MLDDGVLDDGTLIGDATRGQSRRWSKKNAVMCCDDVREAPVKFLGEGAIGLDGLDEKFTCAAGVCSIVIFLLPLDRLRTGVGHLDRLHHR